MNILVLHNIEDLHRARQSTLEYVFAFERYCPEHAYWYHRIAHPPSDVIRETAWDAVILGSTAPGICTIRPRTAFEAMRDRWDFLADPSIVKVVFPQDDANCGGLMDEWFAAWGVQHVFTVRAPEHWSVLYPKSNAVAAFHPCLSGYVDDRAVQRLAHAAKPWAERSRLLGQRVTMYPPRGGRQGRLKGLVSQAVSAAANRLGLAGVDISVDPAQTLFGDAWYEFLGDCKFVLGSEGGLSVNDPYGEIADRIDAFVAANPRATYEEIEAACFAGLDGVHVFSGFSPRVFEAAMCGASQVLVEGRYLGVLEPGRHYLELKRDASNVTDVFEAMQDEAAAQSRVAACREMLIDNPAFRYSALAATVMSAISVSRPSGSKGLAPLDARAARARYAASLLESDRATGFVWPETGHRIAATISAQSVAGLVADSEDAPEHAKAAGDAAFIDVFALELEALGAAENDLAAAALSSLRWMAATLQSLSGAQVVTQVGLREGLSAIPLEAMQRKGVSAGLAQHLSAGATATEVLAIAALVQRPPADLIALLSRLVLPPAAGGVWYEGDLERLAMARRLVDAGVDGGDAGRLATAFAMAPDALAGLASRLAPRNGTVFTGEQLERLCRLDAILVRAGDDGLAPLERFQAYGPRGEAMLDLLAAGGDMMRLVDALAAAGPAVAGIVSRLLPADGRAYTPQELAWLQQVDRILIRSDRNADRLDAIEALQQAAPSPSK